jgi:hypothetical protein
MSFSDATLSGSVVVSGCAALISSMSALRYKPRNLLDLFTASHVISRCFGTDLLYNCQSQGRKNRTAVLNYNRYPSGGKTARLSSEILIMIQKYEWIYAEDFQFGWKKYELDSSTHSRAVDEVGETSSQRLLAAAAAVLLGVPSYPPFVRVGSVYPRVHCLLPPAQPRLARLVRRGRRGGDNINVPPAWLTPVEEGRAGCGCCRHEVHSNSGVCGGSLVLGTSQVVVGDVMTWVPPTRLQACSFGPTVPRGWAVATEKER